MSSKSLLLMLSSKNLFINLVSVFLDEATSLLGVSAVNTVVKVHILDNFLFTIFCKPW